MSTETEPDQIDQTEMTDESYIHALAEEAGVTPAPSGFDIDLEHGRMGVWTWPSDPEVTEPRLQLPWQLCVLKGDEGAGYDAVGQFALGIEAMRVIRDAAGRRTDTELDLILVQEGSATGPARRERRATIPAGDLRNVDAVLGALGAEHIPLLRTPAAGTVLEQLVLAASAGRYPIEDRMKALGWADTEIGLAFLTRDGAVTEAAADDGPMTTSLCGQAAVSQRLTRHISVEPGDLESAALALPPVIDSLTEEGMDLWATLVCMQAAVLAGAVPPAALSIVGPGGIGKSYFLAACIMPSASMTKGDFETFESTWTSITEQGKGVNHIAVVVDDARHRGHGEDEQARAISLLHRIAYEGMAASRSRASVGRDGGVRVVDDPAPARPLIITTGEDPLADYVPSMHGSSLSRFLEVALTGRPTTGDGAILDDYHKDGHLRTLAYEIVANAMAGVLEEVEERGARPSVDLLRRVAAAEVRLHKRPDAPAGADRAETILATLCWGAELLLYALDDHPEVARRVHRALREVEARCWIPRIDAMASILTSRTATPGMRLVEAIGDMVDEQVQLLRLGDRDPHDTPLHHRRRDSGLPVLPTIGGVVEHEGELYAAVSSTALVEPLRRMRIERDARGVTADLSTVPGAIRRSLRLADMSLRRYVLIPLELLDLDEQYQHPRSARKKDKNKKGKRPESDREF